MPSDSLPYPLAFSRMSVRSQALANNEISNRACTRCYVLRIAGPKAPNNVNVAKQVNFRSCIHIHGIRHASSMVLGPMGNCWLKYLHIYNRGTP